MIKKLIGLVGGAALLATGIFSMAHTTGTTEFGYRVNKIRGEGTVYQPGSTYFFLPIVNDWYTLDSKLENLVMTKEANEGDRQGDDSINFKTKDGNDVSINTVGGYRIDPLRIPFIIENVGQTNKEIKNKLVRPMFRSNLRDLYGVLGTEEFYDTETRNKITEEARQALITKLDAFGLIVERVDYRGHWYKNDEYQKALQEKKTAEANSLKLEDAIRAQAEANKKLLNSAQGTVNKQKAEVDGKFGQAKLDADAKLTAQLNDARAIRTEADTKAAGIRAEAEAMVSGGGPTLVQMELIKALQGKPIVMVPVNEGGSDLGIRTLDINRFLEVQGLRTLGK